MKKILIFTQGYLPGKNYGGPVISISNFVNLCGNELDIYIVTKNHDFKETTVYSNIKASWNQVGKAKVLYLNNSEFNYKNIKRIIDEVNADLIYQNSLFFARFSIPLFFITKLTRKKLLVAPRGELLPNALEQKYYKKRLFINFIKSFKLTKNVYFQATTEEERKKIIDILEVNPERVLSLGNIPSLPSKLKSKQKKVKGKLNLVYIARIHPTKNLYFALKCLKNLRGEVTFSIYGSKEIQSYWEKCQEFISELPANITVKYCGIAERQDVHQIYSDHDAMLLPTLTENYGHSIVEAILSNCPVIISNNTPWNDINDAEAGWAISLDDENKYKEILQKLVYMEDDEYQHLIINNNSYINNKLKLEELRNQYISGLAQLF